MTEKTVERHPWKSHTVVQNLASFHILVCYLKNTKGLRKWIEVINNYLFNLQVDAGDLGVTAWLQSLVSFEMM